MHWVSESKHPRVVLISRHFGSSNIDNQLFLFCALTMTVNNVYNAVWQCWYEKR